MANISKEAVQAAKACLNCYFGFEGSKEEEVIIISEIIQKALNEFTMSKDAEIKRLKALLNRVVEVSDRMEFPLPAYLISNIELEIIYHD